MTLLDVVANVVTGGAYGVVTGAVEGVQGGLGGTKQTAIPPTAPPTLDPNLPGLPGPAPTGADPSTQLWPGPTASAQPVPPPTPQATCCDRYRFSEGFLVDGVTGLAWRFDEAGKAFVEVPRKPAQEKLPLFKALLDAQIQTVRNQYQAHLVNTSPEFREAAIKDFEARFVKPIQDSAGLG
jgi:hypothetical protein